MDLEYTIVRSRKRRKLTITVERNRAVVVHAPETTPEEKIRQMVEAKRQWIFEKTRHPQKYDEPPHPPGKELVSGESALYLGRDYQIEITQTSSGGIEFAQRFLSLRIWPIVVQRFSGIGTSPAPRRSFRHMRASVLASWASNSRRPRSWPTATAGVPVRSTTTLTSTGVSSRRPCR
jgi:hypothetical protein